MWCKVPLTEAASYVETLFAGVVPHAPPALFQVSGRHIGAIESFPLKWAANEQEALTGRLGVANFC